MRVLSLKVALAILCAGKLLDKLRCEHTPPYPHTLPIRTPPSQTLVTLSSHADLFSLLADSSGRLPVSRFGQLLEEALILPASVLESPSFHFSDSLPTSIFHQVSHKASWQTALLAKPSLLLAVPRDAQRVPVCADQ